MRLYFRIPAWLSTTLATVAVAVLTTTAYAQTNPVSATSPVPDVSSIAEFNKKILCPIVGWFFVVVIMVSVIMILWGAFQYATGAGEPEKVSKANKTLIYAAVGMAIAFLTRAVPIIVASLLGVQAPSVC